MRLRAIVALVLAGLALMFVGPTAAAQAYPVVTCSTLAVSTTTPAVGEVITVSGSNFTPNATVRLELHPGAQLLTTVTTRADGTFSTRVTLPDGFSGTYQIVAVGGTTTAPGCPADPSVTIKIAGAGVGGVATSSAPGAGGQSPGGTAFTGVNVLLMLIVAAILVVLGVMLNRRNAARHAMPRNDY